MDLRRVLYRLAVEGLDANKDGVYSKEELAPLAKVNVDSLKDFDYFTFVHLDGEDDKLVKLKPPVDYWVDYDKTVLTLHFTLPLETPLDTHAKPVAIDVYDPSFFVAFGFDQSDDEMRHQLRRQSPLPTPRLPPTPRR
jgi:ABC-type uncharacterized transport system substrate-binding protein